MRGRQGEFIERYVFSAKGAKCESLGQLSKALKAQDDAKRGAIRLFRPTRHISRLQRFSPNKDLDLGRWPRLSHFAPLRAKTLNDFSRKRFQTIIAVVVFAIGQAGVSGLGRDSDTRYDRLYDQLVTIKGNVQILNHPILAKAQQIINKELQAYLKAKRKWTLYVRRSSGRFISACCERGAPLRGQRAFKYRQK